MLQNIGHHSSLAWRREGTGAIETLERRLRPNGGKVTLALRTYAITMLLRGEGEKYEAEAAY